MTVYAITDTKKRRTGIEPTYLQTTRKLLLTRTPDPIQLTRRSPDPITDPRRGHF